MIGGEYAGARRGTNTVVDALAIPDPAPVLIATFPVHSVVSNLPLWGLGR